MKAKKKSKKKRGRKRQPAARGLLVVQSRVAGVDAGSREHWICAPEREEGVPNVRVFGTITSELEAAADWLHQEGVKSVAIESTGTYWIPLYDLLEERGIEVVLVDARKLKRVPGRKTDMLDCQWIQKLHACGLLEACFRPSPVIRELRALARERANLKEALGSVVQRMQKALDWMNIKVHQAVTDLTGVTGMSILRAIVAGERDPLKLAQLRDRRCKKSEQEISEHLKGTWMPEHLFNLQMHLEHYEYLQKMVEVYEQKIIQRLEELSPPERQQQPVPVHPNPTKEKNIKRQGYHELRTALWRFTGVDLTRIDAIGPEAALTAVSEVGFDIQRFPSTKHFASWLKVCTPLDRSAGKSRKRRGRGLGSTRIACTLRMASLSLKHSSTALGAYYRRMAQRKGMSIAIGATARKLCEHIYRALKYGQEYVDQGAEAYEARFQQNRLKYAQKVAKSMGYALVPMEVANQVSA